jgi:[ribulose-bisphosphate carboxylase]-lysine N-methyltransferase
MYQLAGQDCFLLEALFRSEAWGHMLAPVSEANERAVYQSMLEGCQAALDGCCLSVCSLALLCS